MDNNNVCITRCMGVIEPIHIHLPGRRQIGQIPLGKQKANDKHVCACVNDGQAHPVQGRTMPRLNTQPVTCQAPCQQRGSGAFMTTLKKIS